MSKAKRDDFRLEEELRSAKAKYEEASEDVFRRMQDIKDAEADSIRDLTRFMDVELDYHERCAEALRSKRAQWSTGGGLSPTDSYGARDRDYGASARRPANRSRSNTAQSATYNRGGGNAYSDGPMYDDEPDEMPPMRMPIRSQSRISVNSAASSAAYDQQMPPARPTISRSSTYGGGAGAERNGHLGASLSRTPSNTMTPLSVVPPPSHSVNVSSLRGQLRPTGARPAAMDVFADDDDTASSDTPPGSASPATSYGSSTRGGGGSTSALVGKKAPPPPPSRAKKPPPPVPNRREREY